MQAQGEGQVATSALVHSVGSTAATVNYGAFAAAISTRGTRPVASVPPLSERDIVVFGSHALHDSYVRARQDVAAGRVAAFATVEDLVADLDR